MKGITGDGLNESSGTISQVHVLEDGGYDG